MVSKVEPSHPHLASRPTNCSRVSSSGNGSLAGPRRWVRRKQSRADDSSICLSATHVSSKRRLRSSLLSMTMISSKRPLGGRSRSELMISTDVSSRDESTPPELLPKPTPRPSLPLSLTLSEPLSLPSPPPPPLSTLCSPSSLDRRRMTFPPKRSVSRGMPWNDVAPPLVPLCRSAGGSLTVLFCCPLLPPRLPLLRPPARLRLLPGPALLLPCFLLLGMRRYCAAGGGGGGRYLPVGDTKVDDVDEEDARLPLPPPVASMLASAVALENEVRLPAADARNGSAGGVGWSEVRRSTLGLAAEAPLGGAEVEARLAERETVRGFVATTGAGTGAATMKPKRRFVPAGSGFDRGGIMRAMVVPEEGIPATPTSGGEGGGEGGGRGDGKHDADGVIGGEGGMDGGSDATEGRRSSGLASTSSPSLSA